MSRAGAVCAAPGPLLTDDREAGGMVAAVRDRDVEVVDGLDGKTVLDRVPDVRVINKPLREVVLPAFEVVEARVPVAVGDEAVAWPLRSIEHTGECLATVFG